MDGYLFSEIVDLSWRTREPFENVEIKTIFKIVRKKCVSNDFRTYSKTFRENANPKVQRSELGVL